MTLERLNRVSEAPVLGFYMLMVLGLLVSEMVNYIKVSSND